VLGTLYSDSTRVVELLLGPVVVIVALVLRLRGFRRTPPQPKANPLAPPGWYRQADGSSRWWDGMHWTEQAQSPAILVTQAETARTGRNGGWSLSRAEAEQAVRGLPRLEQVACGWFVGPELRSSPQAGRFIDRSGVEATALLYAARVWALLGIGTLPIALAMLAIGQRAACLGAFIVGASMHARWIHTTLLSGRWAQAYRDWRGIRR
jgi:hypothetical protein